MSFIDISDFSSGGYFAGGSGTVWAILVEHSCETFVIFFEFGPVVQEEMQLKDISIFSSGGHSAE